MKNKFFGYYKYSKEQFKEIWDDCIFVFDTSVLLNFHKYNPKNVEETFNNFLMNSDRFWIPYHVGEEYHRNLFKVIISQLSVYDKVLNEIKSSKNKIKGLCEQYKLHPYLKLNDSVKDLMNEFEKCSESINKYKKNHPSETENNKVSQIIGDFFEDKIGESPINNEIEEIEREGEKRYEKQISPGFRDIKKPANKYGDFIIWKEIIEYSKLKDKPIVFIVDDEKNDFWQKRGKKIIGPAPDLITEFYRETNQYYYQYTLDKFLKCYDEMFKSQNKELISDVEDLKRKREQILNKNYNKLQFYDGNHKFVSYDDSLNENFQYIKNVILDSPLEGPELSHLRQLMRKYIETEHKYDAFYNSIRECDPNFLEQEYELADLRDYMQDLKIQILSEFELIHESNKNHFYLDNY
ncbi:hypothetical protein F1737_10460 [Methanoplanus sp. FWC-SCC4]|uniref:PIN like domain-containing protein n=1 Tax=Methanochimaera problematica TaxID=2609417 RepID=A0AA97FDW6_9EURY|nr:PIN-like domain-containing protein [Methanoplanus sp. FWC-SCC4]WOF17067.1 hypothetical protein F1737_10460 [Methanoplanus sp. FWC-SCC4]